MKFVDLTSYLPRTICEKIRLTPLDKLLVFLFFELSLFLLLLELLDSQLLVAVDLEHDWKADGDGDAAALEGVEGEVHLLALEVDVLVGGLDQELGGRVPHLVVLLLGRLLQAARVEHPHVVLPAPLQLRPVLDGELGGRHLVLADHLERHERLRYYLYVEGPVRHDAQVRVARGDHLLDLVLQALYLPVSLLKHLSAVYLVVFLSVFAQTKKS